jgi:hypothetical protein
MNSLPPVRNARAVKRTKQYEYFELHKYIDNLVQLRQGGTYLQPIGFTVKDPETNKIWNWRFQPTFVKKDEFILMFGLSRIYLENTQEDDWMLVRNPSSAAKHLSVFGLGDLRHSNNTMMTDEVCCIKDDKSAFIELWRQIQLWASTSLEESE